MRLQLKKAFNVKGKLGNSSAMTLPELMIAAVILILTMSGILISYIRCIELDEISKNMTIANVSAKSKMEEIKNTDFVQIKNTYNNVNFAITGLNGQGVSTVNDANPELLLITVSVSWQQSNGRAFTIDLVSNFYQRT